MQGPAGLRLRARIRNGQETGQTTVQSLHYKCASLRRVSEELTASQLLIVWTVSNSWSRYDTVRSSSTGITSNTTPAPQTGHLQKPKQTCQEQRAKLGVKNRRPGPAGFFHSKSFPRLLRLKLKQPRGSSFVKLQLAWKLLPYYSEQ